MSSRVKRGTALGIVWIVGLVASSASASPSPTAAAVLADGEKAYRHWAAATPLDNNDWTGSTFMIGLMEYYKATVVAGATDASALAHAKIWAEHYEYRLKGPEHPHSSAAQSSLPPGKHIADHQLCGATYIELYKIDGDEAHIADVKAVLGQEIAQSAATSNYWVCAIICVNMLACFAQAAAVPLRCCLTTLSSARTRRAGSMHCLWPCLRILAGAT